MRSRLLVVSTVLLLRTGTAPLAASPVPADDGLRVARIFASGMVLQRHQPIVVWGWATPGTRVTVTLAGDADPSRTVGRSATVRTTAAGTWEATLAAQPAGGPYRLLIQSPAQDQTLRDVLIGDLWLASGQSNMEWPLSGDRDARETIAHARDNGNDIAIREFKIPVGASDFPDDTLTGGAWAPADSAHVGRFSAVAYYFARALRAAPTPGPRVPIGIVNSTWGGSAIEAWIRREAQGIDASAWRAMQARMTRERDSTTRALTAMLGALPGTDAGFANGAPHWAAASLDDASWKRIAVPGYWEGQGYAGLDGVAWYRTTFTLSSAEAAAGVTLAIEALDDDDVTWVNGTEIGRTDGYNVRRRYRVQAPALVAGVNQLTIRVADGAGGGGINGAVSLHFTDGSSRSLAGQWAFRVGQVSLAQDGQVLNKIPGVVYNRMLHPIVRFPVAGVLWYQGESNANTDAQARAYRAQFATLVTRWRAERRAPTLPFLWVQLPNFNAPDSVPPTSAAWALQRESMAAALTLPRTGQAVTIDLGDPDDIHPRVKQPVGDRLARVARRVAYGEPLESSGPTYRSHVMRGDTVVVSFAHVAEGLRGAGTLTGFAVAGADRRWVWAEARLQDGRVLVWSDQVRAPVAVRYAWSNGPVDLTLRNSLDLPAAPFRTDRWTTP